MPLAVVWGVFAAFHAFGIGGTIYNPKATAILFATEVQAVQVATVSAPEMADRFRVELEARGLIQG